MAYNDDKEKVKLYDADSNPIGSVGDSLKVAITGTVSDTHVIVDNVNLTVSVAASDGDNVAIKDVTGANALSISAGGAAKVDGSAVTQPISASALPLPNGAATSANQDTEITSLQLLDDVPSSMNAAFSKGTPVMGQFDDVGTTAATENNVAPVRITSARAIHVNLRNAAGTDLSGSIASASNQTVIQAVDNTTYNPTGVGALGIDRSGSKSYLIPLTSSVAAVKIDGTATTQPISASSLPLPSGAATATHQTEVIYADGDGVNKLIYVGGQDLANQQIFGLPLTDGGAELITSVARSALPTGAATESSLALLSQINTRSDTYTGTANGTTVDVSTNPKKYFTMQVKGTGASATTWDVRLEGSLNNSTFSQILQHTNTTGDGAVLFIGASVAPAMYFRSRCAGLVLGSATNIVVTILGMN